VSSCILGALCACPVLVIASLALHSSNSKCQAEKISDLEQKKLGDCTPGNENIPMELVPETTISGTESTSAMMVDQQVETQNEATEKAQGAKDVAETSASGEAEQVEALESEASFGGCVGIQSSVIQLEPLWKSLGSWNLSLTILSFGFCFHLPTFHFRFTTSPLHASRFTWQAPDAEAKGAQSVAARRRPLHRRILAELAKSSVEDVRQRLEAELLEHDQRIAAAKVWV